MLGGTVGLGSQRYKSITEINVFQEQLSATLLFFYLPCNKPTFRRFLNPRCKALSCCNLGAIRRIKHWLRCKMIPVPAALVSAPRGRGDHSAPDTLFAQQLYISISSAKMPSGNCNWVKENFTAMEHKCREVRKRFGNKNNAFRQVLQLPARGYMGHYNSWPNFLNLALKKGKWLFFTGLTAGTGITNGKELCRELVILWGFAWLVQWPR